MVGYKERIEHETIKEIFGLLLAILAIIVVNMMTGFILSVL